VDGSARRDGKGDEGGDDPGRDDDGWDDVRRGRAGRRMMKVAPWSTAGVSLERTSI